MSYRRSRRVGRGSGVVTSRIITVWLESHKLSKYVLKFQGLLPRKLGMRLKRSSSPLVWHQNHGKPIAGPRGNSLESYSLLVTSHALNTRNGGVDGGGNSGTWASTGREACRLARVRIKACRR